LLFLKHLYREACPPVVPILCSFLYGDLVGDAADRRALLEQLTAAISVAERESGKQACLIAGVDLAHIGPRYGDAFRPDQGAIDSVMNKDREMLQQVCACRPEEFLRLIATERDARRVCGFPAILTALYLSDGCQGDLLHHSYALVDELGSFVTFAGVVFRN
jgi:AmmeMemoRadiSam system protein B